MGHSQPPGAHYERVSDGGSVASEVRYTYDMFDRRISKHIDDDGDTVVDRQEHYVYDGDHIVLQFDELGRLDAPLPARSGGRPDPGRRTDRFGRRHQQRPLAPTDNLGTVRDLADFDDATGITAIANHLTYDAFGNITCETILPSTASVRFTGREWDEESDLYYLPRPLLRRGHRPVRERRPARLRGGRPEHQTLRGQQPDEQR